MTAVFTAPTSVDAAVEALAEDGAVALGGGVALGVLANLELADTGRLVSLGRIDELRGVRAEGDSLVLGATNPHADLAADPLVRERIPVLAGMFGRIGNVRVRAWGTLGGNLALAEPAQDPEVVLTALDAEVRTAGPAGARAFPVADLADGPMMTVLDEAEIITAVAVRPPDPDERCAYLKFLPKTADDYATVSAMARLRVRDGRIAEARLVCGAVGAVVIDCTEAAGLLVGRAQADPGLLEGVAAAVREAVSPIGDHRGSEDYKRRVAGVYAERAVRAALGLEDGR